MTTATTTEVEPRRRSGWREGPPIKLSWGAIFGGTVVALGIWALLYSFGLAIGLSAIDPNDPASARGAGIGTGVWSLIAPLIALFIGAAVASRAAGIVDRVGGMLHGAVLWGLTILVGGLVLGMTLTSLVSGAARLGTSAVGAAGGAVQRAAGQQGGQSMLQQLGLNPDDLVAPINQRLRQQGRPEVTADQLQAATQDALRTGLQQGRLDREVLVSSIAEKTQLSKPDADQLATQISTRFEQRKDQLVQQVQGGALKAADVTGKVFWGVFGALLLGLISALLGSTLGVGRRQRAYAEATAPPPGPGVGVRREVYP